MMGPTRYQNDGDGIFSDVTSTAASRDTGDGRSAAWGDFGGDGDLDLYVANMTANMLYQNDGDGIFPIDQHVASLSGTLARRHHGVGGLRRDGISTCAGE